MRTVLNLKSQARLGVIHHIARAETDKGRIPRFCTYFNKLSQTTSRFTLDANFLGRQMAHNRSNYRLSVGGDSIGDYFSEFFVTTLNKLKIMKWQYICLMPNPDQANERAAISG